MIKIFLSLIFITFLSTSYSQETQFARENQKSLESYLVENNVSYKIDDIAVLKDINSFSYYNHYDKLVVPEVYYFNRDGYRIKSNVNLDACGQELSNIDKINKRSFDKKDNLRAWMEHFKFIDSNEDIFSSSYDAFIVINWAKFLPKMNEVSFNWYNSTKKLNNPKIRVILLNLDIQDSWELNQAQKDALRLTN